MHIQNIECLYIISVIKNIFEMLLSSVIVVTVKEQWIVHCCVFYSVLRISKRDFTEHRDQPQTNQRSAELDCIKYSMSMCLSTDYTNYCYSFCLLMEQRFFFSKSCFAYIYISIKSHFYLCAQLCTGCKEGMFCFSASS